MRYRRCRQILTLLLFLEMAGCAGFPDGNRVIKAYPRPAKETLVAVNQALRDLNFFPTDLVPSHSNPQLTYFSAAYREESMGEIVYVAVRDVGADRSLVEVLTRGDLSGVWTWTTWWPPLILEQTDRRLLATTRPQSIPRSQSAPTPPPPVPGRLAL